MSLQIIHSQQGQPEYVLLPIKVYHELRTEIDKKLKEDNSEYVPFVLENYVSNAAALMRIKANVTQEELAEVLDVSQAYISKIEKQKTITAKTLDKISQGLKKLAKQRK